MTSKRSIEDGLEVRSKKKIRMEKSNNATHSDSKTSIFDWISIPLSSISAGIFQHFGSENTKKNQIALEYEKKDSSTLLRNSLLNKNRSNRPFATDEKEDAIMNIRESEYEQENSMLKDKVATLEKNLNEMKSKNCSLVEENATLSEQVKMLQKYLNKTKSEYCSLSNEKDLYQKLFNYARPEIVEKNIVIEQEGNLPITSTFIATGILLDVVNSAVKPRLSTPTKIIEKKKKVLPVHDFLLTKPIISPKLQNQNYAAKTNNTIIATPSLSRYNSIFCDGVPRKFLKDDILQKHFSIFGNVKNIEINDVRSTAIVSFNKTINLKQLENAMKQGHQIMADSTPIKNIRRYFVACNINDKI